MYDYRSLPLKTVGSLYSGLGLDTRIERKKEKMLASRMDVMLALICDELSDIRWSLSSEHKDDKPVHIAPTLFEPDEIPVSKGRACSYDSAESFEAARQRIMRG